MIEYDRLDYVSCIPYPQQTSEFHEQNGDMFIAWPQNTKDGSEWTNLSSVWYTPIG